MIDDVGRVRRASLFVPCWSCQHGEFQGENSTSKSKEAPSIGSALEAHPTGDAESRN